MLRVCFSSKWPLSGALRQGARMRLFEPGRPSERPPLLPSVNNSNLPYLPTQVPFMRQGERETRESRSHLDSPVLKAECPVCPCSSCSWTRLWLRGNSRYWFPEVLPKLHSAGKGGLLSSTSGLDQLPGWVVSAVACPLPISPPQWFWI